MNITLKSPNVNIGSTNQLVSKAALEAMYPSANNNFTLKITLGGASAAPAPSASMTITSQLSPMAGLVVFFFTATQAYGFGELALYKVNGANYEKVVNVGMVNVGSSNFTANGIANGEQVIVLASQAASVPILGAVAVSGLVTVAV
jgi:hypothetical protein